MGSGTSHVLEGAEAPSETEEKVRRRMGMGPNPGQAGERGRERDDFSAKNYEQIRRLPLLVGHVPH